MNFDLYYAANKADEAFHQALVKVYGKDACNARYDRKRNRATPELAAAGQAKMDASEAWSAEVQRVRALEHYAYSRTNGVLGLKESL